MEYVVVVSSLLYFLQRLQRYDRGIALVPSNDESIGHINCFLYAAAGDQAIKIARGSESKIESIVLSGASLI